MSDTPKSSYKTYLRKEAAKSENVPRKTLYRNTHFSSSPRILQESAVKGTGHVIRDNSDVFVRQSTPSDFQLYGDYELHENTSSSSNSEENCFEEGKCTDQYGEKVSKEESCLLIFAFISRHKLSKTAVLDLLTLLNFHLPKDEQIPSTPYLLDKQIMPDYAQATKKFYCPSCGTGVNDSVEECSTCSLDLRGHNFVKAGNFFIKFNIRHALQQFLQIGEIGNKILVNCSQRNKQTSGDIQDIVSGKLYQSLNLGPFDITCTTNTDGVALFKSSTHSMWPILISVNELDYQTRRKHTIIVGIWFGKSKPNFDSYLKSFVDECNDLSENPLSWILEAVTYVSKIYFPIVAVDSVARSALQGIKQFNGKYGCPWCLIKGESYVKNNTSRRWIYKPVLAPSRTHENFILHLRVLRDNMQHARAENCFGIKSASQFLRLKKFNIVSGFTFDYMHTCLLGVVKAFTMAWFQSKNYNQDYYIGNRELLVSRAFNKCRVPNECSRVTRDLKEMKYWKANEWKTWMLLCVPLLQYIQKPVYLTHFSKFVFAISLLNSSNISNGDLERSKNLLHEFCVSTAKLYGSAMCTFNVHLLLHAVDSVRNWGSLWAYSLFQFEHMNGVLTASICGTSQICMQLVRKVLVNQRIHCMGTQFFINDNAKKFHNCLRNNKKYSARFESVQGITLLGPSRDYQLNDRELKNLKKLGLSDLPLAKSFKKFIAYSTLFGVQKSDSLKRVNSICRVNGKFFLIMKALLVYSDTVSYPVLFVKRITVNQFPGLNGTFKVAGVGQSLKVILCMSLEKSKFFCTYGNNNLQYIVSMFNNMEME